jgi:hypothetical protein
MILITDFAGLVRLGGIRHKPELSTYLEIKIPIRSSWNRGYFRSIFLSEIKVRGRPKASTGKRETRDKDTWNFIVDRSRVAGSGNCSGQSACHFVHPGPGHKSPYRKETSSSQEGWNNWIYDSGAGCRNSGTGEVIGRS